MRGRSTERRRAAASLAAMCAVLLGAGAAADSRLPARGTGARPPSGGAPQGVVAREASAAIGAGARLSIEQRILVDALERIGAGDLDGALLRVEHLVDHRQDFALAQRVYADLLAVKARSGGSRDDRDGDPGSGLAALRAETMARLRHQLSRASRLGLPAPLIAVSRRQRQAMVVDVSAARLYLFENAAGGLRLVADFYVSTGRNGAGKERQNDRRTPLGVYFITGRIEAKDLPEYYGAGALPVDYPNPWDRRLGRTGYGIWIHGSPAGSVSRAPNASEGCVALSNADLSALWQQLDPERIPVVIADDVEWWPRALLAARRRLLAERIERWRAAWQSGDRHRFAEHYSADFDSEGRDRSSWLRRRRAAHARQHGVDIALSDLSLLGHPADRRMVIATFEQGYRSDDRALSVRKRQYWRLEGDGAWRIVYEGVVRLRREHLKGIPVWARSEMF